MMTKALIINGAMLLAFCACGQDLATLDDFTSNPAEILEPERLLDRMHEDLGVLSDLNPPAKVEGEINSLFPENGPIVSPDGKIMYFSRSLHPDNYGGEWDSEDIWYANWRNEQWAKPVNIGDKLNNIGPNFIVSITIAKGKQQLILGNIYKNSRKGKMISGLSYANQKANGWSAPQKFKIDGFYNYAYNTDFCVSEDGQYLITSAERDDSEGFGTKDLYISYRIAENHWSAPFNLRSLNTTEEEAAPFLLDGKYLFFASNGRRGYGKTDIYVAKRLDSSWEKWSKPINLGANINDDQDNWYFYYSKTKSKAFITKGYYEDDTDIFEIDLHLEEIYKLFDASDYCNSRGLFHHMKQSLTASLPAKNCAEFNVPESLKTGKNHSMIYMWYLGESQIQYGTTVSHCYSEPGRFNATMTAIDARTCKNYHNQYNVEFESMPEINIVADIPETTNFDQKNNMAAYLSYQNSRFTNIEYYWDFGDGNFSCGTTANHLYTLPGEYMVRVLASFHLDGQPIKLMEKFPVRVQ